LFFYIASKKVGFMKKFIVGCLLMISFFVGACGSSSSNEAKDPCTDDPNLPECQQEGEEETTIPEEEE
jgi:hypothetical protein